MLVLFLLWLQVEQYKNVILYGAGGTGKSYVARKLAQCVQAKEGQRGAIAEIHIVSGGLSRNQVLNVMIDRGKGPSHS